MGQEQPSRYQDSRKMMGWFLDPGHSPVLLGSCSLCNIGNRLPLHSVGYDSIGSITGYCLSGTAPSGEFGIWIR